MEQVTQRREADPSEYVKAGLIRFVTGFYASPPASGSALCCAPCEHLQADRAHLVSKQLAV
jgi:hypothetical protein